MTTGADVLPLWLPYDSIFLTTSIPLDTWPKTTCCGCDGNARQRGLSQNRLHRKHTHLAVQPRCDDQSARVESIRASIMREKQALHVAPVCTVHRKNWLPLVLGPALAMLSTPGPCTRAAVSIRHMHTAGRQTPAWAHRVLEREVLVSKLGAIDALAARAVAGREVAACVRQAGLRSAAQQCGLQRRCCHDSTAPWHMNCVITRWKVLPLKCSGLPDLPMPFSPVSGQGTS